MAANKKKRSPPPSRRRAVLRRRRRAGASNRPGKIALLALIFLLMIAVLMAVLGNTGHAVKQKMEVQNAADVASFTGSLWMARGMNGITTCNHLIGEATAIGVIHDAIGGPEMRLGLRTNTAENRQMDAVIRALAETAAIGTLGSFYPPVNTLTALDRTIIQFVSRRTSPSADPDLTAFAMLYDARMTLKREMILWLAVKSTSNLLFLIPPPFGLPGLPIAVAAHVAGTARIVLVGKEWLLLNVMELYGRAASPVVERVFASQLIPSLAEFSAAIAGLDLATPTRSAEGGLAIDRIESAMEEVGSQHRVTAELAPAAAERQMPVEFEPDANRKGRSGGWPAGWGQDAPIDTSDAVEALNSINQTVNEASDRLSRSIRQREAARLALIAIREEIEEKRSSGDLSADAQSDYESESRLIDERVAELEGKLEQLRRAETEIVAQRTIVSQGLSALGLTQSQNPSLLHVPQQLDPIQERTTQWVRAAMPNLDALRSPVLGLMTSQLEISRAAAHYEKWTNRYAMIHSWRYRTGMRLQREGSASARWSQREDALRMIVLQKSFRGEVPVKGSEPWTRSDADAKRQAEDLFTLLSAAHRDYETLFASTVMPRGQPNAMTQFAQSILYNANHRPTASSATEQQPIVAWDTLNWDHTSPSLIEWGTRASVQDTRWPWELLDGLADPPRVKLNWQPKWVPVTKRRLETASQAIEGTMRPALELATEHAELIAH